VVTGVLAAFVVAMLAARRRVPVPTTG